MPSSRSIFEILSGLKSTRLISCAGLVLHPTVGLENLAHPIELSFVFGEIYLSIRCASDGESIEINQGKIKGSDQIDMDDLGCIQLDDLSEVEPYRKCIGAVLENIFLIQYSINSIFSGLKFDFDHGISICIVNLGDDLWIFDHVPNHVRTDYAFIKLFR